MKSVRQKCLALVAAFGLLLTGAPMTAYAENAADTGSSDVMFAEKFQNRKKRQISMRTMSPR